MSYIKNTFRKFFPRANQFVQEPQSKIIRDVYGGAEPVPFNVPSLYQVYKQNSWVYVAVNMLVSSCVAVPLKIRDRATKKIIAPTESEPIGAVLKYPNRHITQFELLERLFLHLEICGNAFWELVTDPISKRLLAIYPLDPTYIEIIPDARRFISGYRYTVGNPPITFAPDDIVHFKYPDPQNEYWGIAPVLLMRRQALLDSKVKTFSEKFFDNDATPGGLLKTDRILSDPTYKRIRKRWNETHKSVSNRFNLAILEDGMSYEKIGTTLTEADPTSVKNSIRDEIMMTAGVPPTLSGIGETNYASARIIQSIFFDSQIAPRLRRVSTIVDKDIMNRFNPQNESAFDTSVSPINIAKLSANSRVVARLYTLDLMKKNEARNLLGLTPVDDGDSYYSGRSKAPADEPVSAETGEVQVDGSTGGDVSGDAGSSG